MNIVLFLGAGFSKPIDLPVMCDFFDTAIKATYLQPSEKEFVRHMRTLARQGTSHLVGRPDDLEHVLSFALMAEGFDRTIPPKSNKAERTQFERLCHVLFNVYRRLPARKLNSFRDSLKLFLGDALTSGNNSLTIITTNYDVVVEFFFRQLGRQTAIPCRWTDLYKNTTKNDDGLYARSVREVVLCKLHGSLNWFNGDDPDCFLIENRVSSGQLLPSLEDPDIHTVVSPHVSTSGYVVEQPPVIVPPTLFKMQTDSRFDLIWRTAADAIAKADRFAFVGYSFPQSDVHMRFFLGANLAKNQDLQKIDIVDPSASEIVARLRNDESFGPHFKEMLRPRDAKWETLSAFFKQ